MTYFDLQSTIKALRDSGTLDTPSLNLKAIILQAWLDAIEHQYIVKIRLQAINLIIPMKLKVILESSTEGGYIIYVPSLPGCISEGDDIDDALANIQEAIELYLEPVDDEIALQEGAIIRELVL